MRAANHIALCRVIHILHHCFVLKRERPFVRQGGEEKIDALSVLGSVSFSPQMPFHCIIASQPLPMVKIQFVCFEHIISIAISTHKRSVVDDTEAKAATAPTISTTKSTYYPSQSKRKQQQQHLHLKLLPHPFYFNSFHSISLCFVSFFCSGFYCIFLNFRSYFSALFADTPALLYPQFTLCTFSLVLYYAYFFFVGKRVVNVHFHDVFFCFSNHSLLSSNVKKITILLAAFT